MNERIGLGNPRENRTETQLTGMPAHERDQWRLNLKYRFKSCENVWTSYFKRSEDRDAFKNALSPFVEVIK
jgi:hypothetical protein